MKISGRMIIGLIIIFIGLHALLSALNIPVSTARLFLSILFLLIGWSFWNRDQRTIGGILIVLGALALFEGILNIQITGLVIAIVIMYFGFRLLRQDSNPPKKKKNRGSEFDFDSFEDNQKRKSKKKNVNWDKWEDDLDRELDKLKNKVQDTFSQSTKPNWHSESDREYEQAYTEDGFFKEGPYKHARTSSKRPVQEVSSFIGDFILRHQRFELNDLYLNHGIGDVKIDLSKALIEQGETTLKICAWIGDVQIYVPYDLDVSVNGQVMLGDMDILGYQQSGLSRNIKQESVHYQTASKRVNINISLGIGDVDVRYV